SSTWSGCPSDARPGRDLLARHAPEIPPEAAVSPEDGGMERVEQAAGPRGSGVATRRPAQPPPSDRGQLASLIAALHRPLTSYYLILGITTLLLALGLVMVLSPAAVAQLGEGASPYSGFQHQLVGVLLGLPCMWLAARARPGLF